MDADHHNSVSAIAAAIGEPTRARMLCALLDDRARTATELALIGGVSPSTASAHLNRLKSERLVRMLVQGKHRYFRLDGPEVAQVLERLSVLAGGAKRPFEPNTPSELRAARTCYDHIAGALGVALHDRLISLGWLAAAEETSDYTLTAKGSSALQRLGVDPAAALNSRRRFAFGCVDWSERRPHLGGSLGAALYSHVLSRRWLTQLRGSRVLGVSALGRRHLASTFGLREWSVAPVRRS